MKSTEDFIRDLFQSHQDVTSGKGWVVTPFQRLVFFFAGMIGLGTVLLLLPGIVPPGKTLSFIDALFTSTSAVCVTGLIVQDTASAFTPFGQGVILCLIQVGGLGYMLLATAAAVLMGKRMSLQERATLKEAMNLDSTEGMGRFIRRVLWVTLAVEALGALAITAAYWHNAPPGRALALGVFHAVAAFNNAGFSLFSDNLMSTGKVPGALIAVVLLVILGGLGFFVFNEFLELLQGKNKRLSVHTKLVLITSGLLVFGGAAGLRIMANLEWGPAIFLSVVSRTAGFNMQDTGALSLAAQMLVVLLMFIGASPGGTGGGIKTTTFALMITTIWNTLRGQDNVVVFNRRIFPEVISKAMLIVVSMGSIATLLTLLVIVFEKISLSSALFEVTSALGTVGLSVGDGGLLSLSAKFSWPGKSVIILGMFIGRLGPLTLGLAAAFHAQQAQVTYPEGRVSIG